MTAIHSVTLEVPDPAAAEAFTTTAFGVGAQVRLRASDAPRTGFGGFTLTLGVAQRGAVDAFVASALANGARSLKPAKRQFWGGYSGVVEAPDGTVWKVATDAKKDTGPATRDVAGIVLLLGVADMAASKRFYVDRGFTVAKGYGSRYVEFHAGSGAITLGLYKRRGLAEEFGVSPDGTGSPRIAIESDAGRFTDPDGFAWEAPALVDDSGPSPRR